MDQEALGAFGELVRGARSRRRFDEDVPVACESLAALVDIARQAPSGANRQPLRYRLVTEAAEREAVFSQLMWAGALPDWDGPESGERPGGYIVICDAGHGATTPVDEGIAAQTLLLAAAAAGLGGCMLHAFNKAEVARALDLPEEVRPLMVLALGAPVEEVVLEPLAASPDGTTNYWRDDAAVHHVPKRALEDVLI
ncbi:MAG: nitroreductase family protein [Collinsella sp.]|nr:nitroreductase family protein [Collinsella sp.]